MEDVLRYLKRTDLTNYWKTGQVKNLLDFLESAQFAGRRGVVKELVKRLRSAGIDACLTCSAGLFFKGVINHTFGDFDILVNVEDFETLKEVMSEFGAKFKPTCQKPEFKSEYYQQAEIQTPNGEKIEFDLIGDFWVATFDTQYHYVLNNSDIEWVDVGPEFKVPVLAIEVQLLLYGMMVGWQMPRWLKYQLCLKFLEENGVRHRDVLEKALENSPALPEFIRKDVNALL